LEVTKVLLLLAVLLEIISIIALSYNRTSAQTYDTITKQRETFKNNPQIRIGSGLFAPVVQAPPIAVNPITNKIYVANPDSNTVSVIDSTTGNVTNIRVGISPIAIGVDDTTNKIYVANSGSDTVSVINGDSDKREQNDIPVGNNPMSILVYQSRPHEFAGRIFVGLDSHHHEADKIYVANSGSDTVSVINASNDEEYNRIQVGNGPVAIAAGTGVGTGKIYVASSNKNIVPGKIYVARGNTSFASMGLNPRANGTVSVIDEYTDNVTGKIPVGADPFAIAAGATGKIYVVTTDSVYVIDLHYTFAPNQPPSLSIATGKIPIGSPSAIAVDDGADKIYVASASDTVSVIDEYTDNVTGKIPVGEYPTHIAVLENHGMGMGNKIYVTNRLSNTVSVINSTTGSVTNIGVGGSPSGIAGNSILSMMYVLNEPYFGNSTNTVSVIDGSKDKVAAGVTFNIHPANSGGIWCDNKEYPTNTYLYVISGTKCIARPSKDFEFRSWVENLPHNSTVPLNQSAISDSPWNSLLSTLGMKPNDASATFDVNRFGTFTANFKPVPPSIPPEYWIPLYGIIVSTVVGWSIPSIIGSVKAKRQGKRANQYYERINRLYDDGKLDENNIPDVDKLKTGIAYTYANGKISDQHYTNLKSDISILYEEIYKKRIGKFDIESNGVQLDKIKNDITDAYAKGKISDQHYGLLNEMISDYKNNRKSSFGKTTSSKSEGSPIK